MNDGYCYSLAYSTAHPSGTPETPDTSHFDETFLTNVPPHGTICTFLILVDSGWSLSLKEVDSGLTLLLLQVDSFHYPYF